MIEVDQFAAFVSAIVKFANPIMSRTSKRELFASTIHPFCLQSLHSILIYVQQFKSTNFITIEYHEYKPFLYSF